MSGTSITTTHITETLITGTISSTDITATVGVGTEITLSITNAPSSDGTAALIRAEIEGEFKTAYSTKYTEYTFTGSNLSSIGVWETSLKANKLFTKTLTYTGADLTQVSITDEISGLTLTKTLTYSGGLLDTKTEVLT